MFSIKKTGEEISYGEGLFFVSRRKKQSYIAQNLMYAIILHDKSRHNPTGLDNENREIGEKKHVGFFSHAKWL